MVIFNDVFVPWERVFHCGEYDYSLKFVSRFAKTHRMTCGGTCKVGFMNQIIGASKLIQEYKGLEKAAHINDQLMEMVVLRETGRACGLASATEGAEEPPGSGVFLPDELMRLAIVRQGGGPGHDCPAARWRGCGLRLV